LPVDDAELARLRALIGDRPVWLAASTHAGEETLIAGIHQTLAPTHPGLLTIIVPRHPERGAEIAAIGTFPRRALGQDPPPAGIWVGDTLGEMGLYYRLTPIVFVGRSLVPLGGQNPLEPARLGCAVAMGPHGYNFAEPIADLVAADALQIVADDRELAAWVADCLANPTRAITMGRNGQLASRRAETLPGQLAKRLAEMTG
jgi:3-deoxy-D-manno-octulosonic-acid transferase